MASQCSLLVGLFPENPDFNFITSPLSAPLSPLSEGSPPDFRQQKRTAPTPPPPSTCKRQLGGYQYTPGWRQEEIARLADNPLFPDLQKVVRLECSTTTIPVTILQPVKRPQTSAVTQSFRSIMAIAPPKCQQRVKDLLQFYFEQLLSIETERTCSLRAGNPLLYNTISGMYQERQNHLNSRVEASLVNLRQDIESCRSSASALPSSRSQEKENQPQISAHKVIPVIKTSTTQSANSKSGIASRRPSITPKAVQMMSQWYQKNYSHPYPSAEEYHSLATQANIREELVRKWFVYKRQRCGIVKSSGGVKGLNLKALRNRKL